MNFETEVLSEVADAVAQAVTSRHSCRGYLPNPVPHAVIERMLEISQRSASWCNSQAWHLHITEGEATDRFRKALVAYATKAANPDNGIVPKPDFPFPERYTGIYDERRKTCGLALYQSMGIERGDRAKSAAAMLRNFELFGAPHVMMITSPRDLGVYGAVDCGSFISTFLTVAQSFNVATIAQGALALYSEFVREYFAVPDDRMVLCGISFGYEDTSDPANAFRTERASTSATVSWVNS